MKKLSKANGLFLFYLVATRGGGVGALQLHLYGGVWPQDWKIDPFAD